MKSLNDGEYCASVVDAVLDASKRIYSYTPKGRTKPQFYLVLPPFVDYMVNVLVDQDKRSVAVTLRAPNHSVLLIYERTGNGGIALKSATVHNLELAALLNSPLEPKMPTLGADYEVG
jgi:hypothetical protein